MEKPDPQTIPSCPGVYLYKDAAGQVLYVGKARLLRRRVLSYFRQDAPRKAQAMISHAVSVDFLTTTTEKEAFLLEASLIKKYRPHYNILLRDDKQYALFRLDVKAEFPRLEIVRHARRDTARYFGPFTSALAARETWKLLHRAFPLRRCTDRALRNRVRACLYHHMGQCLAPCMGQVSSADYHVQVDRVCEVLSGKADLLLSQLREEMFKASDALEFETAALLRDQIAAVEKTVERQAVILPKGGDMDVVGLYVDTGGLALGLLFVRNGAVLDGQSFFWPGLDFDDASELLLSFLGQFYLDRTPPARILVPWIPRDREEEPLEETAEEGTLQDPEQPGAGEQSRSERTGSDRAAEAAAQKGDQFREKELLEQSLGDRRGSPVRLVAPQNAADNRLVDIAQSNAREETLRRARASEAGPLARVARLLHLEGDLARIECVDVSHTQGRQTRVGMVVYTNGQPDRAAYRVYNMPDSNDDYATLHAWVARRLESGPPWPDLLLIDGGRGQVASVARALKEAGQEGIFPIAGIAKARDEEGHADRRAGNVADRIFVPGRSNPLPFREGSPELLFLQNVRDATHHFAITRHRRARASAALSGELMRLPGIGTATARLLWDHFGSFARMQEADCDDLVKIPGIGRQKAAKIRACLTALAGDGMQKPAREARKEPGKEPRRASKRESTGEPGGKSGKDKGASGEDGACS